MGRRQRRAAARYAVALVVVPPVALVVLVGGAADAAGRVAPDPDASRVAVGAGPPPRRGPAPMGPVRSGSPAGPGPALASGRGWGWPLDPRPEVLARFDPPQQTWGAGHRGVDLAAAVGQPVLAPSAGVVTFSGVVVDRGVVVVTAASGLRSSLEPVTSSVPVGAPVARGQVVGQVSAATGHCVPVPCLHWGVRRDETYLDPLALVGSRRVVLLPLRPP